LVFVVHSNSPPAPTSPPTTRQQLHPDTTTSTTTTSTSSLAHTLSAHHWVTAPQRSFPTSRLVACIEFSPAVDSLTWFAGCSTNTAAVALVGNEVRRTETPTPPRCHGIDVPSPIDRLTIRMMTSEGALTLIDANGDPLFVAEDPDRPATASDILGDWRMPEGGVIRFGDDGHVGVNYCADLGDWTLSNGLLALSRFDATKSGWCASSADAGTLHMLRDGPTLARSWNGTVTVRAGGESSLLSRSTSTQPAFAPATDALDVDAATVYGFRLSADLDSNFVVGVVDAARGAHTFDSGWYETASSTHSGTDVQCSALTERRFVRWGDFTLGFIRIAGEDRLWAWAVGNDSTAMAERFSYATPLRVASPSGLQSRPPQLLWLGASVAEVRSATDPNVMLQITLDDRAGRPTTSDTAAVRGTVTVGNSAADLRLAAGRITWMSGTDRTSCG
jgi:hypothetical protein